MLFRSFGLPAEQIDGQDVCAMYRSVSRARKRAAEGEGPTFIEALTFRYRGHNTGDPQRYRTKDEVLAWETVRDPIHRLIDAMGEHELLTPRFADDVAARAREVATDAIAFAEGSEWPSAASATNGVYGSALE